MDAEMIDGTLDRMRDALAQIHAHDDHYVFNDGWNKCCTEMEKREDEKVENLSEGIEIAREIVSPKGERAFVATINRELGPSMVTTVVIRGEHFDLELRSSYVFNELFRGWRWGEKK